ncbi:unnamed protein product [Soboliphyme baturini]|uniref:Vps8 domain-containing protein n=1 Tax=Soboliphyme baturini TaxID=241478 RepID=A0A183IHQ5_9BILA|nr:unnamed protein product [Soboliphyme baturini]
MVDVTDAASISTEVSTELGTADMADFDLGDLNLDDDIYLPTIEDILQNNDYALDVTDDFSEVQSHADHAIDAESFSSCSWKDIILKESDSGGSVFLFMFKNQKKSYKIHCLFSGCRGEVCDVATLLPDDQLGYSNASFRDIGLIAMASINKVYVVALRPSIRLICIFELTGRPFTLPFLSWRYESFGNNRIGDRKQSSSFTAILLSARDMTVRISDLSSNDGGFSFHCSIRQTISVPLPIINASWLCSGRFIYLDSHQQLHIYDLLLAKTVDVMDASAFKTVYNSNIFKGLACGGNVSSAMKCLAENACYHSVVVRDCIYFLGTTDIYRIKTIVSYCIDLSHVSGDESLLYSVFYPAFSYSDPATEIFFEVLTDFIIMDVDKSSMPTEVMDNYLKYHEKNGSFSEIEKSVVHFPVESLNINYVMLLYATKYYCRKFDLQVYKLCNAHGLFDAVIYVCLKAFMDYIHPLKEMFTYLEEKMAPGLALTDEVILVGNKLLLYLKCAFIFNSFFVRSPNELLKNCFLRYLKVALAKELKDSERYHIKQKVFELLPVLCDSNLQETALLMCKFYANCYEAISSRLENDSKLLLNLLAEMVKLRLFCALHEDEELQKFLDICQGLYAVDDVLPLCIESGSAKSSIFLYLQKHHYEEAFKMQLQVLEEAFKTEELPEISMKMVTLFYVVRIKKQ